MLLFDLNLLLAFLWVSISFKINKNVASFSNLSSYRSCISRSQLNLRGGMPNLVADFTSEKTKLFVDLVATILRRQLVKFDSNDEQTSVNTIEVYKSEQFLSSSRNPFLLGKVCMKTRFTKYSSYLPISLTVNLYFPSYTHHRRNSSFISPAKSKHNINHHHYTIKYYPKRIMQFVFHRLLVKTLSN